MRQLSLAAGALLDHPPSEVVRVAAATGWDALGLRFDPPGPDEAGVRELRRLLGEQPVELLDVEFVRLGPGADGSWHRRLVEMATALGARHLLVVSVHPDPERTVADFAALCETAGAAGDVRPVLEFMRFTAVPRLADAVAVVRAAGRGGVLVDALHLHRGGTAPAALAGVDETLLPYLQLCDAPRDGPDDPEALAHEARHARLPPGEGELPLHDMLAAVPAVPLSVEVTSDALLAVPVAERAAALLAATRALLSG